MIEETRARDNEQLIQLQDLQKKGREEQKKEDREK